MNKFLVLILTFLIGLPAFSQSSSGFGWQGRSGGGGGMTNPMTTTGDTIYSSDGSGTPARLGIGKYDQQYSPNSSGVPAWSDRPLAPSVTTNELRTPWCQRITQYNGNAFSAYGTGSASSTGTAASSTGSGGVWVRFTSSATSLQTSGLRLPNAPCRFDSKPRFWSRFKVVDTLGMRFFCGLSGVSVGTAADTNVNTVGFRYNPATDTNGNIRFYTMDGTTANVIDTGVAYSPTTGTIVCAIDTTDQSSVKGYINGVLVATSTTNLPIGSTPLLPHCLIVTLENVAKAIDINSMYGDQI